MNRFVLLLAVPAALAGCQESEPHPGGAGSMGSVTLMTAPSSKPRALPSAKEPDPDAIPAPSDVSAAPSIAEKTPSGLASRVLRPGTGTVHPSAFDSVKVHYTGWTKTGDMFDSSVTRKEPATFRLNQVIPGWTEGVALMVEGEKRRFWIPAVLAYGTVPKRPGAPAGDLVFDVELLSIEAGPKLPKTPEDVSVPPSNAKKTPEGIAYRVLSKGKGGPHPTESSTVAVEYAGWTTDGKMFDASALHENPMKMALGQVIEGWRKGIPLMSPGDHFRFWIPENLAYGKDAPPGAPHGMLVFDITLASIEPGAPSLKTTLPAATKPAAPTKAAPTKAAK